MDAPGHNRNAIATFSLTTWDNVCAEVDADIALYPLYRGDTLKVQPRLGFGKSQVL